jgi:hypothetical protein
MNAADARNRGYQSVSGESPGFSDAGIRRNFGDLGRFVSDKPPLNRPMSTT